MQVGGISILIHTISTQIIHALVIFYTTQTGSFLLKLVWLTNIQKSSMSFLHEAIILLFFSARLP